MANAWILAPYQAMPAGIFGQVELGDPAFPLNDYAGVQLRVACTTAGTTALLYYDLGAEKPVDTIMVFGVSGLPVTASMNVQLRDQAGNVVWQSDGVAYAGETPLTGGGVSIWSIPAPISARTVIVNYTAAGASVQLARMVIGRRIQLERNFSHGATFGVRDLGSLDFSARGVLLRRRGARLRTASLTFSSVRRDEVEAMVQPLLERLGNTDMVALLTDPTPHPQRQSRCFYGPLVGDLATVRTRAATCEAKVNLVSIF